MKTPALFASGWLVGVAMTAMIMSCLPPGVGPATDATRPGDFTPNRAASERSTGSELRVPEGEAEECVATLSHVASEPVLQARGEDEAEWQREIQDALRLLQRVASGTGSGEDLEKLNWNMLAPALAGQRPQELLDLALRLPSGQTALLCCVEAFRSLAGQNAASAWLQLSRLGPGRVEREATYAVLGAWAENDPTAAARAAQGLPGVTPEALGAVAEVWARRDPAAALGWVDTLPAPAQEAALTAAARGAAQQADAPSTTPQFQPLLDRIDDPTARAKFAAVLAEELVLRDPSAAFEWAARLPPSDRASATAGALAAATMFAPRAAAQQFKHLLAQASIPFPAGPLQASLVSVAEAFAATDSEAAIAWSAQLPAQYRADAMRAVMHTWAQTDAVRASEWLIRQPTSLARQEAALAFATQIAPLDPAAARQWLSVCPPSAERAALAQRLEAAW